MTAEKFVDCLTDDINESDYEEPPLSNKNHYKYRTLRGKTKYIAKSNKFILKETTLQNLIDCFCQDIIIIPSIQRDINYEKINNMITTFHDDNETFNFLTNPIQLVYMREYNKYLLIDGQHRFCMYRQLLEISQIKEDYEILVNITLTDDKDKIYKMYKHFNYDIQNTIKTIDEFQIDFQKIFKELNYDKFSNINCRIIKKYFSITTNQYIYTFEEFIKILYDSNYIELFESIDDSFEYLIQTNNIFATKFYTTENINELKLKKEEINNINRKIIYNLKHNNFLELLLEDDIRDKPFEGIHTWIDKKKKYSITVLCN